MPSEIFVLGLSWRTAPVRMREKIAYRDEELESALNQLCEESGSAEAVLISTCNRVEIYGCTAKTAPASEVNAVLAKARNFLVRSRHVESESVSELLYEHAESDAVRHIFRVASALDSMVLGESQILGQLKAAYGASNRAGRVGPVLGRCMERAFGVAKRVRSETGVSRGAANVSSVAVELALRVFGDLVGKQVLVVGAGKMSALAARHLRAAGAASVAVTNRSVERANELAEEIEGDARPWEKLVDHLSHADVVISSTGSREPVLDVKLLKSAMKKRRYRPLVVIDIAVPRDVDPRVTRLDGVYLFDIDDLQQVVAENLKERGREAEAAQVIVEGEVEEFSTWMRQQAVVPTIRALREHFHRVAGAEAERTIQLLSREHTAKEREQAIRRLAEIIVNKLLHSPMTALKGDADQVQRLIDAANRLFALSGEEAEEATAVLESAKKRSQ